MPKRSKTQKKLSFSSVATSSSSAAVPLKADHPLPFPPPPVSGSSKRPIVLEDSDDDDHSAHHVGQASRPKCIKIEIESDQDIAQSDEEDDFDYDYEYDDDNYDEDGDTSCRSQSPITVESSSEGEEDDEAELKSEVKDVSNLTKPTIDDLIIVPTISYSGRREVILKARFHLIYLKISKFPGNLPIWKALLTEDNEDKFYRLFRKFISEDLVKILVHDSAPSVHELEMLGYQEGGFGSYVKMGASVDWDSNDMLYVGSTAKSPSGKVTFWGTRARRLQHLRSIERNNGGLFDNTLRANPEARRLAFSTLWFYPIDSQNVTVHVATTGQIGSRFTETVFSEWLQSWNRTEDFDKDPSRTGTEFWSAEHFSYIGSNFSNPLRNCMNMIIGIQAFKRTDEEWKAIKKEYKKREHFKHRERNNERSKNYHYNRSEEKKEQDRATRRNYDRSETGKEKSHNRYLRRKDFLLEYGRAERNHASEAELIAIAVKYGREPRLHYASSKNPKSRNYGGNQVVRV
ncbi:uncharacterized protein L199_001826 [Kwoniella botswanensis]|uniref:uncharacterized protein n=1 Tax=Kwoniella botswanensis TaxID=1268659 RepID=UPI00315CD16C